VADTSGDPEPGTGALAARVPGGVLTLGTEVTSVEPGGKAAARVATTAGDLDADLVVAADGIGSATRPVLFPRLVLRCGP
jgi:2-polyprenyl-6-methoxyphenol hydroxylase-like FAD-dependent oxidoreductase